jgi:hypothetical protein
MPGMYGRWLRIGEGSNEARRQDFIKRAKNVWARDVLPLAEGPYISASA